MQIRDGLKIEVNQTACIQYFLIFIMIQYIGGRLLEAVGSDLFYMASISICFFLMLAFKERLPVYRYVFSPLVLCGLSMGITYIVTGGDLSIGTILAVLSRFLIVYVAVCFDKENFISRFLKLVYIMAIISLVEFAFVQIVGVNAALNLFSNLYRIKNPAAWLGDSYGLFLISYNFMDPTRNTYIFGEPGEYQSLICTALFFLTFCQTALSLKDKKRYLIVFLITLVTIQSTTGYFNLIVYFVAIIFSNRDRVPKFVKNIILPAIALATVFLVVTYSPDSFVYRNFVAKVFSDSGQFDLAVSTGAARVNPIMRFVETLVQMPHKLILGVGFEGLSSLPLKGFTVGIINTIAMLGLITSTIIYYTMFKSLRISAPTPQSYFYVLFLVLSMGLSQPDLLAITSVLMCMCGTYLGDHFEAITTEVKLD